MKKNKSILECTLSYGECYGFQESRFNDSKTTYNYDCTQIMTLKKEEIPKDNRDLIRIPYYSNKYTYKQRGEDFFNYSLKKIYYELREDKDNNNISYKRIQHLKLIFIDKEGKEEILLDTSDGKELPEKIELLEGEVIEYAIIYLKDNILCGLDLTTSETKIINKSYIIGTNNGSDIENELIKAENKIIAGIGCYANEKMGITAIYFYLRDKRELKLIGSIGLRLLRAKVKTNEEFKENIEKNKKNLNDVLQLTYDICCFPESVFFEIIKYTNNY